MQRFERYFQSRMQDPAFKTLYARECHVCAKTVQIFAKLHQDNTPLTRLAEHVEAEVAALVSLRDGDCCDPKLVIRLCHHLGLPKPEHCPRLEDQSTADPLSTSGDADE